jgi:hypothetical protein
VNGNWSQFTIHYSQFPGHPPYPVGEPFGACRAIVVMHLCIRVVYMRPFFNARQKPGGGVQTTAPLAAFQGMLTDNLIADGNGSDLVMIFDSYRARGTYIAAGAAADAAARNGNDIGVSFPMGQFQSAGPDDVFTDPVAQMAANTSIRQGVRMKTKLFGDSKKRFGLWRVSHQGIHSLASSGDNFLARGHHHQLGFYPGGAGSLNSSGRGSNTNLHETEPAGSDGLFESGMETERRHPDSETPQNAQKIGPLLGGLHPAINDDFNQHDLWLHYPQTILGQPVGPMTIDTNLHESVRIIDGAIRIHHDTVPADIFLHVFVPPFVIGLFIDFHLLSFSENGHLFSPFPLIPNPDKRDSL